MFFFSWYSQKCFQNGEILLKYQLICKRHKIYTSRHKPSLFSDKWPYGENQLHCQEIEFNHVFWKVRWKWKVILKFIPSQRMNILCLKLSLTYLFIYVCTFSYIYIYMYIHTLPPLTNALSSDFCQSNLIFSCSDLWLVTNWRIYRCALVGA